jgi:hypothetical protein
MEVKNKQGYIVNNKIASPFFNVAHKKYPKGGIKTAIFDININFVRARNINWEGVNSSPKMLQFNFVLFIIVRRQVV